MLIKATRLHPGVSLQTVTLAITWLEITLIWCLALSLSSTQAHCWSSPLPSNLMSVFWLWPLIMMTDPGPGENRQTTTRVKYVTNRLIFKSFDQNLEQSWLICYIAVVIYSCAYDLLWLFLEWIQNQLLCSFVCVVKFNIYTLIINCIMLLVCTCCLAIEYTVLLLCIVLFA
jgi:hypothetical protein